MNDTIQKYIVDERARGVADSAIIEALLAQGWKKEDVDGAFMAPQSTAKNMFTGGMFVGRLGRAKYIPILIVGYVLPPILVVAFILSSWWYSDYVYIIFISFISLALIFLIVLIALVLRVLGATVRRLHDIGHSGWWTLLFLVSPLGFILSIFLCFKKGDTDGNTYGPVPNDNVSFWQALRGS